MMDYLNGSNLFYQLRNLVGTLEEKENAPNKLKSVKREANT